MSTPAPGEGAPSGHAEHQQSLRRAAYLTTVVGTVHATLLLLAYYLLTTVPNGQASDAELTAFYSSTDHRRLIIIGLYIMPFAGIAFLWFIVALRMWIAASVPQENVLLSNVQLVSGIVFIALFFTGAGASASVAASVEYMNTPVDPVIARQLPLFSRTILLVFAMRMAAMFVFTTSNIGRSSGALPRWFVFCGYAVGLFLLLSATFSTLLVLVFPVWVLVLCAILFNRARKIPAYAVLAPHGGALTADNARSGD